MSDAYMMEIHANYSQQAVFNKQMTAQSAETACYRAIAGSSFDSDWGGLDSLPLAAEIS